MAAGAAALGAECYERAASAHASSDLHSSAAQALDKAARGYAKDCALDSGARCAAVFARAADEWLAAGETARAAETAQRGATKTLAAFAATASVSRLLAHALDCADAALGKPELLDVYREALASHVANELWDTALATAPRYLAALDAASTQ